MDDDGDNGDDNGGDEQPEELRDGQEVLDPPTQSEVDDDLVTAQDVIVLNQVGVGRSAVFVRFGGVGLIVIGVLGALAWAYTTYRIQDQLTDGTGPFGAGFSEGPTLAQRLDAVSSQFFLLVVPVLAIAIGLLLRLVADYAQVRVGASLTGYEVGDHFEPEPNE
jgi:hypothetical protein